MSRKSPLALMKEKFGDKAKLVEAVEKLTGEALWVNRTNKDKGLARVSNAKLLRLHATFTEVASKFGTRDKLIDAILELEKRVKDAGFRQHLAEWPVPRLYDTFKSITKRHAAAAKAAKGGKRAKPAAAAKPAGAEKPAKAKKAAKPAASKKS